MDKTYQLQMQLQQQQCASYMRFPQGIAVSDGNRNTQPDEVIPRNDVADLCGLS